MRSYNSFHTLTFILKHFLQNVSKPDTFSWNIIGLIAFLLKPVEVLRIAKFSKGGCFVSNQITGWLCGDYVDSGIKCFLFAI